MHFIHLSEILLKVDSLKNYKKVGIYLLVQMVNLQYVLRSVDQVLMLLEINGNDKFLLFEMGNQV